MTLDEINQGEGENIEYKADLPSDNEKFLKTVVAFANSSGGKLVFGIEDHTCKIIGFTQVEAAIKADLIANSIYDSCSPRIKPGIRLENFNNKKIIIVSIPAGMTKPYFLSSKGVMDGTFIRIGGVTRKADEATIFEFQMACSNRSFDQMPTADEVSEERINKLSDRMYAHALSLLTSETDKNKQKKAGIGQFLSWKLVRRQENKFYATNSFHLLENGSEEIPDAFIQCAVFKGNDREIFLDRKEIRGPIDLQIERTLEYVMEHIDMGSRIESASRKDFYELPLDSIREMIVNAVCHRSYLRRGGIQVAIYDNRLEITSPGRLDDSLTLQDLKNGCTVIRNPAIISAFTYMHLVERWGSGIPRIFKDCEKYALGYPSIGNIGPAFRISINRRPFDSDYAGVLDPSKRGELKNTYNNICKKNNKKSKKDTNGTASDVVLGILFETPHASQSEIASRLEWSIPKVKFYLRKLKTEGKISRKGNNRSGRWVVLA